MAAVITLATLLLIAVSPHPASAGAGPTCCICEACALPPASQCFEDPALPCSQQCSSFTCGQSSTVSGSCTSQRQCTQFRPPAGVPAMAPGGLALAAVVLTGLGLRAMRRRR